MKKIFIIFTVVFCFSFTIFAHTPLMYVDDNYDGTISIEGAFSDGSSASGFDIIVVEDKPYKGNDEKYEGKKVLYKTKLDKDGLVTIFKPSIEKYLVWFDGGPGHQIFKAGEPLTKSEKKEWRKKIKAEKEKLGKWYPFLYGLK